ncbi:MAG: hypothetical protein ABL914_10970 [Novosphingobium sp.]|uniref:hypothetical protein n=1 Tax=Novosphingobium sp. TaxID=1874826 RepID=UPI0032BBBC0E
MARYATEADRLRAHNQAFKLAMELGCTPKDAEVELRRRAGLASIEEKRRRMAAMQARSPRVQSPIVADDRWMMRD